LQRVNAQFNLNPGDILCRKVNQHQDLFRELSLQDAIYRFYVIEHPTKIDAKGGKQAWLSFIGDFNTMFQDHFFKLEPGWNELNDVEEELKLYQKEDGNVNGLAFDLFVPTEYSSNDKVRPEFCELIASRNYQRSIRSIPKEKRGMFINYTRCKHNKTYFELDYNNYAPIQDVINDLNKDEVWDFLYSLMMHVSALMVGSEFYLNQAVMPVFKLIYVKIPRERTSITLQYGDNGEKSITTRYQFVAYELEKRASMKGAWEQFCTDLETALNGVKVNVRFGWLSGQQPKDILQLSATDFQKEAQLTMSKIV